MTTKHGEEETSGAAGAAARVELEESFRLLVESVRDYAIFMLDPKGFITTWNVGAQRIKGYDAHEIVGQHFSKFYPADAQDRCATVLATAEREGRYEEEGWRVRKGGARFWAHVVVTALRKPGSDKLEGFAKVTRDLTERRIAEDERVRLAQTTAARDEARAAMGRLARLQDLVGSLAGALTPEELAAVITKKGAEVLEAQAAAFLRPKRFPDGRVILEALAFEGVPPAMMEAYRHVPVDKHLPLTRAFRTQQPQWIETPEELRQFSDLPVEVRSSSACALPLIVRGHVSGVVSFRFDDSRSFSEAERAFMNTFATQAASALDRADVYAREVVARRRLEALGELASSLSAALTTEDVAKIVVESGMNGATADTCTLYSFNESTRQLDLIAERGCNPEIVKQIHHIGPESPTYGAIATGTSLWVETAEEYARVYPELAHKKVPGERAQAFWSVPLIAEGKPIGLLGMGFHQPRTFPPGERDFVTTFSHHCAEALVRAHHLEGERRAREVAETLQASLATTLRSIGDAVIATDSAGRVTIMNPLAEELTGYTEADAHGQPLSQVFNIINETTREPVTSPVDKVLDLGTVVGLANHTVLVHRDGKRETPIDDSGAPIRGADGTIDGVVLVFRDVTDKKREETRRALLEDATAALAESLDYETTLAKVARLAVPGLADWCAVDVVTEDFLEASHPPPVPPSSEGGVIRTRRSRHDAGAAISRQVAIAHVDPAKVQLARDLAAKYPPDPDALVGVPNVLRTGQPELYPLITEEMIRASAIDDEHLRISLDLKLRSAMVVPLIARDRTLGAMTYVWAESANTYTKDDLAFALELARRCAVAIDNARLYAGEQSARQSADIANRAKDEFLATVSHELRTPLNAIMGWAKMLASGNLDETKRGRAVETIDRNAVAMAQLIEDLLDISRIISGKMRLEIQSVDLAQVIEAAIESVKPAADARDIRVTAMLDTSMQPHSHSGDPTRLQQIVWNLLSNAVKFTPKGGRIDVVTRREGSGLVIHVTDTGKGIDPKFLPHVFDPFRQEDASHTRSRGGLGLGLAITKQLVELHGGRIEAHSEGEGRGSTFTVHLPMVAVAVPPEKQTGRTRRIRLDPKFERPTQLRDLRVLVVDDEEDARLLVKAVLEDCGCVVTVASSVASALQELAQASFDVLVSDIGMPHQDGYDLIRQVRALPAASRVSSIPAAALTAYARAEDRRRALNAGYSMHIAKPVEPAELVAVVASLTRFVNRPAST